VTRRSPAARASEEGSTLPLIVVYAAIALVLVLIVGAATSLYLERKRLYALADATALAAAEPAELRLSGPDGSARLDGDAVERTARSFLDNEPGGAFEGLTLDHAGTRDGRSATVTLSAYWRPPLLAPLVPEGLRIAVTSSARSAFW